jgi:hypothetical protein
MRTTLFVWLSLVVLAGCGSSGDAADAGGSDAQAAPCSGMSLGDCRVASGCVADLCFACSCTPQFEGCRREADPAFECPALGCPQPLCCGEDGACPGGGGLTCVQPGDSLGCGVCNPTAGSCTSDAECAPSICEPIECSCSEQRACVPGCASTADCGEGLSCDIVGHRCLPASCSENAPCPDNFICADGLCARASCTGDTDCDGFCVDGKCFDSLGTCKAPPP